MGVSSEPGGLRIGPFVSPSTQTLTPLRFRVGAFDATFRDLRVHFLVSKILGLVPTTKKSQTLSSRRTTIRRWFDSAISKIKFFFCTKFSFLVH